MRAKSDDFVRSLVSFALHDLLTREIRGRVLAPLENRRLRKTFQVGLQATGGELGTLWGPTNVFTLGPNAVKSANGRDIVFP